MSLFHVVDSDVKDATRRINNVKALNKKREQEAGAQAQEDASDVDGPDAEDLD